MSALFVLFIFSMQTLLTDKKEEDPLEIPVDLQNIMNNLKLSIF